MRTYSYKDINKKSQEKKITEKQNNLVLQAEKDFETSAKHIRNSEFYTWRAALKSYHLSTQDRQAQLGSKSRKQNITIGLVRSFVDILIASLNEKPLVFIGTAINKLGSENKEAILKTLNYISDVSGFHTQLKETMGDGLIFGEISMRIGYKRTKKTEKYVSVAMNDIIEEVAEVEEKDYPYAVSVSVFNIFPDPYTGPLRYNTERAVVSYENFIETFGQTIRSKVNDSPFKSDEFLKLLKINPNGADFQDYGNIVNQIHESVNANFAKYDSYDTPKNVSLNDTSGTSADEDLNVTEGLIEFKATWYNSRLIIKANNYPVYIGPNPYGFIPYVIKAANQTKARFGEGIPYMLKPLEDVGNSFVNNYLDSARAIANPTMVVQKNLMINDDQLEDGEPGGVVYTEDNQSGSAVYRLDKGGLNDFNVLALINQIAGQITGISEYDQGISAKERTASGALAVSQSSQKRLSPYVSSFLEAISIVAQMWLKLIKRYWGAEQMIYILDEQGNQTWEAVKKKGLTGGINLSLETEGMFGTNDALELKKLIDLYNTLAPSGFAESPEIAKEIVKKSGYHPSRFITEPGAGAKPDNADKIIAGNNQTALPGKNDNSEAVDTGELLREAVTPNIDLGNGGQGSSMA